MRKNIILFSILTIFTIELIGCSHGNNKSTNDTTTVAETLAVTEAVTDNTDNKDSSSSDFAPTDVSVAGWKMTVDNVLIDSSLSHASTTLGYTNTDTGIFEKDASEGNVFVLIKMTITKDGSTENIEWENMSLSDAAGNRYHRIEDTFIEDLNMKRIPGTTLNFGSYEGWFAFEVPESASDLVLTYTFENEEMTYSIQ